MSERDLLQGNDPTTGIVAIETLPDTGEAALFIRRGEQVVAEKRVFNPYLFLSNKDLLAGIHEEISVEALEGNGHYRYLALFKDEGQLQRARIHIGRRLGKSVMAPGGSELERAGAATSIKNPTSAFMALAGVSLFKELPFRGLRRLQFDVEAYTSRMPNGSRYYFSNAARATDQIITIGMRDSEGWSACLSVKGSSEREMLLEFVRLVKARDPDVIEVYNAGFDLRYLQTRADQLGIMLDLGREWEGERRPLKRRERSGFKGDYDPLRDADEFFIFGRHVVDVYLSVFKFDQRLQVLPGHGLKEAAEYFGLNRNRDRAFLDGDDIAEVWDTAPEEVSRYCMDDVQDTGRISELLSASDFDLAQITPAAYGRINRMGPTTILNLLLIRAYLAERQALPRSRRLPPKTTPREPELKVGVWPHAFRVSVLSLPTSLMRNESFIPTGDELGVFPQLLEAVAAKTAAKRSQLEERELGPEQAITQAEEASWRSLLDAFPEYLASTGMPLNDPPAAARFVDESRTALHEIIRMFKEQAPSRRLEPVMVTQDEIIFGVDEPFPAEGERQFIAAVGRETPAPVELVPGGRSKGVYIRSAGNMALLGYDGDVRSIPSLRGRYRELILRELIYRSLAFLLDGQEKALWEDIRETRRRIRARQVELHEVCRSETCRETPENYLELLTRPGYGRQAVHELMLRSEGLFEPGDVIQYYVTGSGTDRPIHETVDCAFNWDPARLNIDHLLERMDHSLRGLLEAAFPHEVLESRLAEGEPGKQLSLEL